MAASCPIARSYDSPNFAGMLWEVLVSARPAQLLKTVAVVAWARYCAGGNHFVLNVESLLTILGMIGLWAGLYGLNDIADMKADRTTVHKRFRPLPGAKLNCRQLLVASALEIAVSLCLLAAVGQVAFFWAAVLVLNQLAYSFEPLHLKRRFGLDVASAAVLSHGARFAIGFQGGTFGVTACVACAALILWKIAAYLTYRLEDIPACGGPKTDTASVSGARNTRFVSAAALCLSYLCCAVYALRSHVPGVGLASITLIYGTAVALYLKFRRRESVQSRLELLVFSAAAEDR